MYCCPDNAFHTSRFPGQDTGVMKVDVVVQVYAVLSHGWFHWLIQPDVPVELHTNSVNRKGFSLSKS